MSERSRVEKEVNDYLHHYIKLADAKIAGFISVATLISGFSIARFDHWFGSVSMMGGQRFLFVLFCISILPLFLTILFSLLAIGPRAGKAVSLVSFPDIAEIPTSEYIKRSKSLPAEEWATEYWKHNSVLSQIAVKKYGWLRKATMTMICWVSLVGIFYLASILSAIF